MKTTETQSRHSVQRIVIQRLLRKWRRKAKEFGKQVRQEWEHGDRYASRRYEGESIALRWCAEDLEAALYNLQPPASPWPKRKARNNPHHTKANHMKRTHYTGDRTHFRVTCGNREITQGYVHPGVGVTFALDCDSETRASIDAAAMELHRDGRLAAYGAMQGLYLVERVKR